MWKMWTSVTSLGYDFPAKDENPGNLYVDANSFNSALTPPQHTPCVKAVQIYTQLIEALRSVETYLSTRVLNKHAYSHKTYKSLCTAYKKH